MREQPRIRKRHPHHVLTARTAHQASTASGRQRRIADGGGLYSLVAPNGSKCWVLGTVVKGKRGDIGLRSVTLVAWAVGGSGPSPDAGDCTVTVVPPSPISADRPDHRHDGDQDSAVHHDSEIENRRRYPTAPAEMCCGSPGIQIGNLVRKTAVSGPVSRLRRPNGSRARVRRQRTWPFGSVLRGRRQQFAASIAACAQSAGTVADAASTS
jgi:hypothetical protein